MQHQILEKKNTGIHSETVLMQHITVYKIIKLDYIASSIAKLSKTFYYFSCVLNLMKTLGYG